MELGKQSVSVFDYIDAIKQRPVGSTNKKGQLGAANPLKGPAQIASMANSVFGGGAGANDTTNFNDPVDPYR